MTKTFTTFDASGTVIYKGRGKVGAAQKAIDALDEYRDCVKAGSGNLCGLPFTLGHIEADGVVVEPCGSYYVAEDMVG